VFERAGLELLDCSKNSRLKQTYPHITLERAVALCKEGFPEKPLPSTELPHCSKFAPTSIQERIARWPGYHVIGQPPGQRVAPKAEPRGDRKSQQVL
jgi:hypothetical protein